MAALPAVLGQVGGGAEIHGITADSRTVRPGDIFVAISGVSVDGHRFIGEAVNEGAVAIVGERPPEELDDLPWGTFTYVRVADAREAWGWMCAAWHDFPSRKMTLIGVTGTDGKTTTVNLIYAILRAAGLNAGMVSTVNARIGGEEQQLPVIPRIDLVPYLGTLGISIVGALHARVLLQLPEAGTLGLLLVFGIFIGISLTEVLRTFRRVL